jgi:hypothetical protein
VLAGPFARFWKRPGDGCRTALLLIRLSRDAACSNGSFVASFVTPAVAHGIFVGAGTVAWDS